ncbi:MAG: insulinase family protein [Ignavibacteria bacterium]|nr:insulinase family protein [Ignavibacteria bacterium]MBT8383949.1 insulinase family protein [Ignavibacteria bacterium]
MTKIIIISFVSFICSSTFAQFQIPEYEKHTLPNGLTLYLMEQQEVPLIYVSAIFPAGAVWDGNQSGLAALTAEALLFGSLNYTKDDIEQAFDFLGADISTGAGMEGADVSLSFKKNDFEKLFPIFVDVIKNPSFHQFEVEKRIKRWIAELEQNKESPRRVIRNYFNKLIFGSKPYGNPVSGTKTSVSELTAEELRSFFNLHYSLPLSCIAVVGDFSSEELKKKIETFFPAGPKVELPLFPKGIQDTPPLPTESRVLLVDKADARETTFMIGSEGVAWNNPDLTQIDVINTILGGRFTSWLNTELRINSGLTYGARSGFRHYKYGGTFYAYSFTAKENTVEAIDLTLKVLDKLHSEGIDEETLSSAKNYMKGQFPPGYETSGDLANLLTTMFFYGLDDSYINNFEENVDAMTVERANEIIAKYFPKEYLQFVLIGKADEIRDKVTKYGKIYERSIEEDGF